MAVDIRKHLPDTSQIEIPFVWIPTKVLMDLPAADFYGEPLSCGSNANGKRSDPCFEELRDHIESEGWLNPVYVGDYHREAVGGVDRSLGNGHHRVVAAYDLGYTHVPVTLDDCYQWESDGPTSR